MLKKVSIVTVIIISITLILVSARFDAGNSQYEKNPGGHDRKKSNQINPSGEIKINDPDNATAAGYFRNVTPFCQFWYTSY